MRFPAQEHVSIWVCGLALWALVGPVRANDEEPPPKVLSRTLSLTDAEVHDAVLPGKAVDVTAFPGGGVAVLIVPEDDADGPRRLYRVTGRGEDLKPVLTDLPAETETVMARPGALWIGVEDRILRLPIDEASGRPSGPAETALEIAGLKLGSLRTRGLVREDRLYLPEVGRLGIYEAADAGRVERVGEIPLPVTARRSRHGFELESPALSPLSSRDATLWGTVPEALGGYRFHAYVVDPAAQLDPASESAADGSEDPRVREVFFRFRGPEAIERHFWTRVDGKNALLVATAPSDKLGIFQKLNLRLFRVGDDRTRAGRTPRAELQTVARRWASIAPTVRDVDGDGKDDLLLVQEEGLGGGDLVIDLFQGRGSGLLDTRRPRRTKLKDTSGGWHLDTDFNGDGRADFLLVSDGRLQIFDILPQHKKRVLADKPFFVLDRDREAEPDAEVTVVFALGTSGADVTTISARGSLRLFDADGDERPEMVLQRSVGGRAVIRAVYLKDPGKTTGP